MLRQRTVQRRWALIEIKGLCFAVLDQIPSHTILQLKQGCCFESHRSGKGHGVCSGAVQPSLCWLSHKDLSSLCCSLRKQIPEFFVQLFAHPGALLPFWTVVAFLLQKVISKTIIPICARHEWKDVKISSSSQGAANVFCGRNCPRRMLCHCPAEMAQCWWCGHCTHMRAVILGGHQAMDFLQKVTAGCWPTLPPYSHQEMRQICQAEGNKIARLPFPATTQREAACWMSQLQMSPCWECWLSCAWKSSSEMDDPGPWLGVFGWHPLPLQKAYGGLCYIQEVCNSWSFGRWKESFILN